MHDLASYFASWNPNSFHIIFVLMVGQLARSICHNLLTNGVIIKCLQAHQWFEKFRVSISFKYYVKQIVSDFYPNHYGLFRILPLTLTWKSLQVRVDILMLWFYSSMKFRVFISSIIKLNKHFFLSTHLKPCFLCYFLWQLSTICLKTGRFSFDFPS